MEMYRPTDKELTAIEAEILEERGREVERTPEDFGIDEYEEELIEKHERKENE